MARTEMLQGGDKGFAERTSETVRNVGIVGGVIGLVAAIAGLRIGETIFWPSAGVAVVGEVGRRFAKSGKRG